MLKRYRPFRRELVIFLAFLGTACIITVLHLLFHPVRMLGMDTSIFYMDEKYTLASYFSTVTAFLAGFTILTHQKFLSKKDTILHFCYGLFFIVLAFDEYFEVHEYANTLIKAALYDGGLFAVLSYFSWIFPLFLVIMTVFVLFGLKLKRVGPIIRLPLAAGIICFCTVLVCELLGAATYGQDIYVLFVALEEGAEMAGVSFFLLAALLENATAAR